MVAPVEQEHVDRRASQRLGRAQPAKPAADDDDARTRAVRHTRSEDGPNAAARGPERRPTSRPVTTSCTANASRADEHRRDRCRRSRAPAARPRPSRRAPRRRPRGPTGVPRPGHDGQPRQRRPAPERIRRYAASVRDRPRSACREGLVCRASTADQPTPNQPQSAIIALPASERPSDRVEAYALDRSPRSRPRPPARLARSTVVSCSTSSKVAASSTNAPATRLANLGHAPSARAHPWRGPR